MANWTEPLNEIKGLYGKFAKSSFARKASTVASAVSHTATEGGASAKLRAVDTWTASGMLSNSGIKNIAIGAGIGGAVNAGSTALNGGNTNDIAKSVIRGSVYGAAGGAGYNLMKGARSAGTWKPNYWRSSSSYGPQNIYKYSQAAGPSRNRMWQAGNKLGKFFSGV